MSKRTRGARRPNPHQRAERSRRANRRTTAVEPLAIAADDLLVAEPELAAPPPMAVVTAPDAAPARTRRSERGRPSALLAAQAASEYVYVAQDLRRIAAVAGLIFGLLLALWLIIGVAGLSPV